MTASCHHDHTSVNTLKLYFSEHKQNTPNLSSRHNAGESSSVGSLATLPSQLKTGELELFFKYFHLKYFSFSAWSEQLSAVQWFKVHWSPEVQGESV